MHTKNSLIYYNYFDCLVSIEFYILYLFLLVFYICIKKLIPALGSNNFYMFFAVLFISEIVHGFMSGALIESNIWMAMCFLFSYNSSIIPNGNISRKQ